MKKTILIVFIIISSLVSTYSQEMQRDLRIEEYFKMFEVEVEVWADPDLKVVMFEDYSSRDFDEMAFQLGYLMTTLSFMFEDIGENFEETGIDKMVYSFFIQKNYKVDRYTFPNLRYDIYMENVWLKNYFNSPKNVKKEMLFKLFEKHYAAWFPAKRKF